MAAHLLHRREEHLLLVAEGIVQGHDATAQLGIERLQFFIERFAHGDLI